MSQATITKETLPMIHRCFEKRSGFAINFDVLVTHQGHPMPHGIKTLIEAKRSLRLLGDDELRKAYEVEVRAYFAFSDHIKGEALIEALKAFDEELRKMSRM